MSKVSIGIDVGGTYAKIGLVNSRGEVLRSERLPTQPRKGPAAFVRRAKAVIREWPKAPIGLALAGGVDSTRGALLFVPNLPGWTGYSFKKAFGPRTVVENDANAAAWGGWRVALKGKPRTTIAVTLGTGVGGGLIVDGRLHRGAGGYAGEIGHMTLELNGPLCRCGRRGCLEAYAGSYGIARGARRYMRRPPSPFSPKALAEAARAGDRGARRAWNEVGERLGQGLANLVLVFNPDAVLILGGVAAAGHLVLDPVKKVFAAQPFREPFRHLTLFAPGDRDWGVIGAALLAGERS